MNAQPLSLALRAHLRLIILFGILGLLLGVANWMLVPRSYAAKAQVLATVKSPEASPDTSAAAQLAPDYLATQGDIIKSDRVAKRAVERLGLTNDANALADYRASGSRNSAEDYFANNLQRGLTVVPSTTSRVISLEYKSPSPNSAAAIANAFAVAYQDVSLDLQIAPAKQSLQWYSRNAEMLRDQLAKAQQALTKRQRDLGVTATLEQTDGEEMRLNALSQALAAAQASQAAAQARTGAGAMPDAMTSPVVQGLQSDIARLEGQRRLLATRAGPNNPDMRELDNQIASLRQEVSRQSAVVARTASATSGQANVNVADLERQVNAQKQRVIQSRSSRGDVAALQQEVDTIRKSYDDLMQQQSQARLLGSGEQTNVTVLSPATPPASPSGLPGIVKAIAGLLFGLLIGAVLAIVYEFLDQRIRRPEDAEVWLGIPNLGPVHALGAPGPKLLGQPRRLLPSSSRS